MAYITICVFNIFDVVIICVYGIKNTLNIDCLCLNWKICNQHQQCTRKTADDILMSRLKTLKFGT